jgi:hypothetical protein
MDIDIFHITNCTIIVIKTKALKKENEQQKKKETHKVKYLRLEEDEVESNRNVNQDS